MYQQKQSKALRDFIAIYRIINNRDSSNFMI